MWLVMSDAYRVLRGIVEPATGDVAGRLRARLAADWPLLERERSRRVRTAPRTARLGHR